MPGWADNPLQHVAAELPFRDGLNRVERKFCAQQVLKFQFLYFALQLLRALLGLLLQLFGRHVSATTRSGVRFVTLGTMIGSAAYYALLDERYRLTPKGEALLADLEGRKRRRRYASRKGRDQVLRDLGLTKVRGAKGGTYWE